LLTVPVAYSHGISCPERQKTKLSHWLQYSEKHPSFKLRLLVVGLITDLRRLSHIASDTSMCQASPET